MTIGVKYANTVAALPGSWTSIDVAQCYARYVWESYNSDKALDQTKVNYRVRRLKISITVGKLAMNNATYRGYVESLLGSYYIRVKDTRFSFLGDTNTINLIHSGDAEPARDRASLLTEDITIELESEIPV